jgi:hypothetical protein
VTEALKQLLADYPAEVRTPLERALVAEVVRLEAELAAQPKVLSATEVAPQELVDCDNKCGAKLAPQTVDELRAALEHWRFHSESTGCSHGR